VQAFSVEKRKRAKPVQWGSPVVETIPGQAMFLGIRKEKQKGRKQLKG
jgi:hypothetical protein